MYDAIVLAGGTGRRLGGVDKATIEVAGRSLLDRVLLAVSGASNVVVVGPTRDLPAGVVGTSEQPPGGGPVAGVAAGLELVEAPLVAVLACDLPFVTERTIGQLRLGLLADTAGSWDGAQVVDESGKPQPLIAVYRTVRLRVALAGLETPRNAPMRALVERLTMLGIAAESGEAWDCDTWTDVTRARCGVDGHPLEEA